ncbi:MAG TPA: TIGR03118 family protein [Steroidobacteraceae bacterium]|jgi:uncharacterized protein (TIGR03118 family)|nr:TIGR03118 family protein [Steroidobacteraceae bacterium]
MKSHRIITARVPTSFAVGVCALSLAACGGGGGSSSSSQMAQQTPTGFTDTALVSNNVGVVATATTIDANLSNPWGLATAPGLPFWIADNNSNLTTLYSGTGAIQTKAVTGSNDVGIAIPASAGGVPANPNGEVYNGNSGFLIDTSKGQETAMFIFDGEGGTIAAWAVDSGATAVTAYDDGLVNGANHAVYKGLALGTVNGASFLYATDLHNNKIDVFDTHFSKPAGMQGRFIDPNIPTGFVPFGIAVLSSELYVTYAMRDTALHDEVTGAGFGYVDKFDFNGNFISRFASAGALNAPWGIAVAPAGFGSLEGDLLIGNFGDGTINIFSPDGTSMGPLTVVNGGALAIPGLWSLAFGDGDSDKPLTTLFYTAGFANQTDGVFGSIATTSTTTTVQNPY